MSFVLDNGIWKEECVLIDKEGNESVSYREVSIVDVPVTDLLVEYEDMVLELSQKEVELYNLKEAYLLAERKIVEETDFKSLYGANNQKVRDTHVKAELADMYSQRKDLEFSIDFIRNYIPLLREVIRSKQ